MQLRRAEERNIRLQQSDIREVTSGMNPAQKRRWKAYSIRKKQRIFGQARRTAKRKRRYQSSALELQDEKYAELSRIAYYIDATGEEAQKQSFRYQVESYGGIFEESKIWKDIQKTEDGLYLPEWYGGYLYEGLELYPVFARQAEVIQTAAGPMKKHAVMECHTDQGRVLYSKEELSEIFLAENRITVSESLL